MMMTSTQPVTPAMDYGAANDDYKENKYDIFCKAEPCERIKLVIATCVVSLLIFVLLVCVALRYSVLQIHPVGNFILLLFGLTLLAYVEALHYAGVAVEKWDMEMYRERFPRAVKCQALVNTPEKVKKFLVGRQFFVIFVVFLIAQITTFPGNRPLQCIHSILQYGSYCVHEPVAIPSNFAGLPSTMVLIFLTTGLPGVFLTLTIGQLVSLLKS
jgi:hypothetical protein